MALYQNGILISGANTLPQMTLAEYQALPVSERPTYWERTDLNYNNIPASDVAYESGTVADALDDINDELTPSTALTFATANTSFINNVRRAEYVKVGKVVTFNIFFDLSSSPTNGSVLFTINDSTLFPKINSVVPLVGVYSNTAFKVNLNLNGNIELNSTQTISANLFYAISGTYICV